MFQGNDVLKEADDAEKVDDEIPIWSEEESDSDNEPKVSGELVLSLYCNDQFVRKSDKSSCVMFCSTF